MAQQSALDLTVVSREPSVTSSPAATEASKAAKLRRASTGTYETPLPFLQGTWVGRGKGIYPTVKDFEYNEEIVVTGDPTNPRPVLFYKQRTWSMATIPKPMHEESGFIRVLMHMPNSPTPRVEWVLSAPNGVTTVEEGTIEGTVIRLRSTCVGKSSTARAPFVTEFTRTFHVDLTQDPPTMHYTMDMATTTTPVLTRHLEARLTKVPNSTPATSPIPFPMHIATSPAAGASAASSVATSPTAAAAAAAVTRSISRLHLMAPAACPAAPSAAACPAGHGGQQQQEAGAGGAPALHHSVHTVLPSTPQSSGSGGLGSRPGSDGSVPLSPSTLLANLHFIQ